MKKNFFHLLIMLICSYISFACANISDYRVMTWNLQGASAATESKWNVNVRQLLSGNDGVDILMVQEAGVIPASAVPTGRHIQPFGVGIPIDEYTWNLGTTSRQDIRYIYYSRTDVGAHRVNLAIVSRQRADNVYVLPPTTVASRPVIGIGLGNDVFLTAHALANGGPDAAAIVRATYNFFNEFSTRHLSWFLAGDFNRDPSRLESDLMTERLERLVSVLAPTEPTQVGGGILDYGIILDRSPYSQRVEASRNQTTSHLASDHYPVAFLARRC
ncbi:TPA: cytolethal distending toxin subunit B family protein [Salmonella enterica]|uniref:Cytolethal distending toxin subunit B family protein n=1 Tax=Salmonella diarizonae TaxID=59204 RepID=A0A627X457_SALDZ|nr:cytolethal distending toxin subunit B family protein [Salmonella enterica]EAQ6105608.1 cytolethal distending toxin subunit B family protein [Salmonella enterica]EAQ6114781.1 cytolethal distending toxin subunit B family protein [Salmonella enterica]ECC6250808.1 cytolethal distending toxin subunit B family protein [Salmonella enterica]ECE0111198.1 cytolethal distending toxin subunit B family protein [Salmonella enterica subsp. diarizonae]ECF6103805.1 cytolethal distending toxin subunit B fami